MIPGLLITEGQKRGLYLQLEEEKPFWIGRVDTADFVIKDDPSISSLHCCIIRKGSQLAIKDESTNGTKLNGRKIHKDVALLKNTDILCVGDVHFQVVDLDANSKLSIEFDVESCLEDIKKQKEAGERDDVLEEIGPYVNIEIIGSGGVGVVYKSFHKETKNLVAVKILSDAEDLDSEFMVRFMREIKLLKQLDHSNIIRLYDADTVKIEGNDCSYIALEYFQGVDLNDHVKVNGPMSWQKVFKVLYQILQALEYMHSQGVIHRDLKPHNILYNSVKDIAKIIDFGFGKSVANEEERKTFFNTKTGSALGTPDFMPIEQWHDAGDVDKRADIYSLGASAYFMLTGDTPHGNHQDVISLYHSVFGQRVIPLKEKAPDSVPESLIALLEKMMAFKVGNRYQDTKTILVELQNMASALTISLD